MKAVILAGGKGTRLRSVVSEVPKPLAPINGRPFLQLLLDYLESFNFNQFIISTGYMAEKITELCGNSHNGVPIIYAKEETPLGTGGAIKFALSSAAQDDEYIYVLNGDTFLKVDFNKMLVSARAKNAGVTIATKKIDNCYRYGTLSLKDEIIKGFNAAGNPESGYINGGIYLLRPSVLSGFAVGDFFSFERDFLESYSMLKPVYAYQTEGYFIDIGIPEDYKTAQKELQKHVYK